MVPLTLAMVDTRLARIAELNIHHQEMATNARNNENVMNDLIAASEVHTQNSLNTFQHLKTLYISSVALHVNGHMYPLPLASLMTLFHHHLAAESKNAETHQAALALRASHGAEHQRHVSALAALELQHIVLLALRAEIISRSQGARNTWLKDLNLYI